MKRISTYRNERNEDSAGPRDLATKNWRLSAMLACAAGLILVGCGDDDKTMGERLDNATEAVEKKAEDVGDAVVGKEEETRAQLDARLAELNATLKRQISELESKQDSETEASIRRANKARVDELESALDESDAALVEFRKASEAEWKAFGNAATGSFEKAKVKVDAALERQKLTEDANKMFEKLSAKIESLKAKQKDASRDVRANLEKEVDALEPRYEELKRDYRKFQDSTEDNWDDFKSWFSKSYDDLSANFKGLFD